MLPQGALPGVRAQETRRDDGEARHRRGTRALIIHILSRVGHRHKCREEPTGLGGSGPMPGLDR
jgi:hypothetical protein